MRTHKSLLAVFLRVTAPTFLLATASLAQATPTFWTGSTITFTHDANTTTSDMLTTNHVGLDSTNNVWLTRGTSQPLFNAAAESAWNAAVSPVHTLWALSNSPTMKLTNANTFTYDTFANVVGQPGHSPGLSVGKTFYIHIVPDDIYLSLKLTAWGNNNGGSFQYIRTTPAPPTPTVNITNPVSGAVFAAPANLKLSASASGTVTNVQFFANTTSLGSVTAAPFNLTSGSLAAGPYSLTAVATAEGITATSPVVNVTVVTPLTVNLSGMTVSDGQFSFNYSANTGLTYVVESSSNLINWVSLATNMAASNPVPFSDPLNSALAKFYRVGRLPNP